MKTCRCGAMKCLHGCKAGGQPWQQEHPANLACSPIRTQPRFAGGEDETGACVSRLHTRDVAELPSVAYPMTAPNYSVKRSHLARVAGLGKKA